MKIDLHLHTRYSTDSLNSLNDIVKRARALGVTPAITDHNNIDAHQELRGMGFEFIPGEEIRTLEGDLIGLYLNEVIAKKTPFLEALDLIKGQDGLSYLPHMYDGGRHGVSEPRLAKKVDIVEVHNPRCIFAWQNEKALEFAKKNKKYMGAGGDSHFIHEIGDSYVQTGEFDLGEPKGLLKALKEGKIFSKKPAMGMRGITTAVKYAKKVFRL